ncbi:DUF2971 domain-containing protein [Kiloniella litopenaei]|uniref:DUF2971 domain-containing protein n=1 Tax=Kiloniella litopenaei TaxID=1549748 RepID=UPI003BACFF19
MTLPPLYKYLDVQGAKLTLGNQTFKHAKPSDFNDTKDLTIRSIFPEEIGEAVAKIEAGFLDALLQYLDVEPTCSSPRKERIQAIQRGIRDKPEMVDIIRAENEKLGSVFDYETVKTASESFLAEINEFMQEYRILCVTTHLNSEKMWADYADNHQGIALRIEPNLAKDSIFSLFRPVSYVENRPTLYDDSLEFISQSLFGDQMEIRKAIIDKIIYSKTLKWKEEGEYRLSIPLRQGENWNTLKYHPEEITELYLGLEMETIHMESTVSLAQGINPDISIFLSKRSSNGDLIFESL